MTVRRAFGWLFFIPVAAVVLLFAVANRAPIAISLDPLNVEAPILSFTAPLYLVLFAALGFGVVLGGFAAWLKQGRYRRGLRDAKDRVARLEEEAARRERDNATTREPAPTLPAIHPF